MIPTSSSRAGGGGEARLPPHQHNFSLVRAEEPPQALRCGSGLWQKLAAGGAPDENLWRTHGAVNEVVAISLADSDLWEMATTCDALRSRGQVEPLFIAGDLPDGAKDSAPKFELIFGSLQQQRSSPLFGVLAVGVEACSFGSGLLLRLEAGARGDLFMVLAGGLSVTVQGSNRQRNEKPVVVGVSVSRGQDGAVSFSPLAAVPEFRSTDQPRVFLRVDPA